MVKKFLSIIIPTFKRNKKLIKIIKELVVQIPSNISAEIIVIGNDKNFDHYNFKNLNKKKLTIKYFKIDKNSNAKKRNKGIKNAKGKYFILIDDDCLPAKNFIIDYLKFFKKIKDKDILCGSVKYLEKKIKKENFTRYRQSRHFINETYMINKKDPLEASKIVTMNMGMKNSKILKKTNYFNEKFGGYGFEDYEFGYRLKKEGFNFLSCKPAIYHLDERDYRSYLNKIYFLSRYSVNTLQKLNLNSWKNTIYFKVENNLFVNLFFKIKFFYNFIEIIEKFIEYIERNIFFYLPKLYRFGIFLSYCRGYYDRKRLIKNKNYQWYE